MDISFSEGNNFKIKGKSISLTTSPFAVGEKIIYGPGEYEIGGVSVMGYRTKEKSILFLIEVDKLNVLFLGDFVGKIDSDLMDELGEVDVVLATSRDALVESMRFDPYFVITSNEEGLKELGMLPEMLVKFSIKKEDIMEDQSTKAIVLSRK